MMLGTKELWRINYFKIKVLTLKVIYSLRIILYLSLMGGKLNLLAKGILWSNLI